MFTASRIDSDHIDVNPRSGKAIDLAERRRRNARPLCSQCHRRPAVTRLRGRHVVLQDHDVCRQCWRTWMDARRAGRRAR